MLDYLPMPHEVTVTKAQSDLDAWGIVVEDSATAEAYRARVVYNTTREAIDVSNGEQIVFTATLLLSGVPAISYDDTLSWADDFGEKHELNPLTISYKHDFSGKAVAVSVVV